MSEETARRGKEEETEKLEETRRNIGDDRRRDCEEGEGSYEAQGRQKEITEVEGNEVSGKNNGYERRDCK